MKKKLNVKEYLKNPDYCPMCGSDDITAGEFDPCGDIAYRDVECLE